MSNFTKDLENITEGLEGCSKGCGQVGCGIIMIPILIAIIWLLLGGL